MKKYIRSAKDASVVIRNGSYLLDRDGVLLKVDLHVPSTTFMEQGINYLVPTDAEFLLNQGYITPKEALSIAFHGFYEYLDEADTYSMLKAFEYVQYAEMKYATKVKSLFLKYLPTDGSVDEIEQFFTETCPFSEITDKWYKYLCNQYVKVYRYGSFVEFRISSTDGFDWNKVIIDKCILAHTEIRGCRFEVAKQSGSNVKFYFRDATISDILESDKTVLSSTEFRRVVSEDRVSYQRQANN